MVKISYKYLMRFLNYDQQEMVKSLLLTNEIQLLIGVKYHLQILHDGAKLNSIILKKKFILIHYRICLIHNAEASVGTSSIQFWTMYVMPKIIGVYSFKIQQFTIVIFH